MHSLEGSFFQIPDPSALRGVPLNGLTWTNGEFNDEWLATLGSQDLPLCHLVMTKCDKITGTGLGWMPPSLRVVALDECKGILEDGLDAV